MLTKQNIFSLIVVVVMLAAIPLVTQLLREQQILRSRATVDVVTFAGDNVQLKNSKLVAVEKDIKVRVASPFEGTSGGATPSATPTFTPTPTGTSGARSPQITEMDIQSPDDQSNVADNQNVVITFETNGDVNYVNVNVDSCQRWTSISNATCNESGTDAASGETLVQTSTSMASTMLGRTGPFTITWPHGHIKHTPGTHTVTVTPYYFVADGSSANRTGTNVNREQVTIRGGSGGTSAGQAIIAAFNLNPSMSRAELVQLYVTHGGLTPAQAEVAHVAAARYFTNNGHSVGPNQIDAMILAIKNGGTPNPQPPRSSNGLMSLLSVTEALAQTPCYTYATNTNPGSCTKCDAPTVPYPEPVGTTCVNCNPNAGMQYDAATGRCVPLPTPTTPSGGAPPPPPTATPTGTITPSPTSVPSPTPTLAPHRTRTDAPAGTRTTHFKVSETNSDAAWGLATAHEYTVGSTNEADYTFVAENCVTTPCDEFPRKNRRVYVQFIGRKTDNTEYKEVWSGDIILGLKPVINSASCTVPATGTGTLITLKGLHFGDEVGGVSLAGAATTTSAASWTNLEVSSNSTQGVAEDKDVILTTVDGQPSDPVTCSTGKSQIDFKATLACRSSEKPLSTAEIEIREDTPQGKSVYKESAVSFDSEGRPQGLIPELTEGKSYKLIIKAPNTLSRVIKFTASAGTTGLEAMNLPLGDVSPDRGDCQINQLDRSRLISEWAAGKETDKKSDLNLDSRVNSLDYSCLMSNFRKECDKL